MVLPDGVDRVAKYRRAAELTKSDAVSHASLANVLVRAGKSAEAGVEYEQAVKLNPGYVYALADWGNLLATHNNWTEANSKWEQAMRTDPKIAYVYLAWASALSSRNRNAEAVRILRRGLAAIPSDGSLRQALRDSMQRLGADGATRRP